MKKGNKNITHFKSDKNLLEIIFRLQPLQDFTGAKKLPLLALACYSRPCARPSSASPPASLEGR